MTDCWLIHRHFAEQNHLRLDLLTREPQQILLFGADGDNSRALLAARYPKAAFCEYDGRTDFLRAAADARGTGWLAKLTGKSVPQTCQAADAPLPEASADMLWANLGLIQAAEPLPVFRQWGRALKTEGLLFFTHFGRDSLAGLLGRLKNAGIECATPMLFDMHDLGDMLPDCGFYDPVMDTAKLQLDYARAETFWQDMATLGLWQSLRFADAAAENAAREHINAWFSDGPMSITLETVYGHAVKKNVLPEGESPVQFYPRNSGAGRRQP